MRRPKTAEKALVKDAVQGTEKTAAKASKKVLTDEKARFITDKDGVTVDTKTTPKGSYQQPDGGRTDVLQDKPHFNKSTQENVGQSQTHEPYSHTNPATGKSYSVADNNKAHRTTCNEVKNIEEKKAKKIN